MPKLHRFFWIVFLALLVPFALAGCGEGGPDGDTADEGGTETDETETATGDNAAFVGTWALREGNSGVKWYILFKADNSWLISDTADGSAQRVYGTYVVEGNVAAGPMVNPGTGEGEIVAELNGATLSLDFVEYWHDPHKHVAYLGEKL